MAFICAFAFPVIYPVGVICYHHSAQYSLSCFDQSLLIYFPGICRDIKGANLLVDASGVVKLADFGMAKHVSFDVSENYFHLVCR